MTPLAGLLIEYLVVGAIASMWLGPVLATAILTHEVLAKDLAPVLIATLLPAMYLVGMLCDWIGYRILCKRKTTIEESVQSKAGMTNISSQTVHAFAVAYEPKLAEQLDLRSARDRIARGAFVACIPLLAFSPLGYRHWWIGTLSGAFVLLIIYALWNRMQGLSAKYEVQVLKLLWAKHAELRELSVLGYKE